MKNVLKEGSAARWGTSLVGGLAGAASITLLSNLMRKYWGNAPRLDKLGEQAIQKVADVAGAEAPDKKDLVVPSFVSDIIGNTVYFSAVGGTDSPIASGIGLGLMAGLTGIYGPKTVGLSSSYTAGDNERKIATTCLYITGGLIAGIVVKILSHNEE